MSAPPVLNDFVPGYPRLAAQVALRPELGIYRRFTALHTRIILYLHAEIVQVERELSEVERNDHNSNDDRRRYCQNAGVLLSSEYLARDRGDERYGDQLRIVERLHHLLNSYNQAILQQAALNAMEEPHKRDIRDLQNFLQSDQMSFAHGCHLTGRDRLVWGVHDQPDQPHASDLVSTVTATEQDAFTRWCAEKVLDLFWSKNGARFLNPDPVRGDVFIKGSKIERFTHYVTTALAPLLLVAAITALYVAGSMATRLVLIALFTVLLSLAVAIFTTTPKPQIFAITAAFAAVQVVFMATNDSCNACRQNAPSNSTTTAR